MIFDFRPSGGQSYSSPSSGHSSSGGGGGGDLLFDILFWLVLDCPQVGIPLLILVILFYYIKFKYFTPKSDWSAGNAGDADGPGLMRPEPAPWQRPAVAPYETIRAVDPGFSGVVFEDFLYSLYAEVQVARGAGQLDRVSAYLTPDAARALGAMARGRVETVIVGKLAVGEASAMPGAGTHVVTEIESNYTENGSGYYVRERWVLVRDASARSRDPKRARLLGCPSCGAPQEQLFGGKCRHCGKTVNDGSFDWTVSSIEVIEKAQRGPLLTSNVEEQGTDLPTVLDPALPAALNALRAKDPQFGVEPFKARLGLIFNQFQGAWSNRDLAPMRPFLSDALFTVQQYWVQAYLAQHLRNVTEGARITSLQVVKVSSDAYYDAVTARVFATSLDYTVNDAGKVVAGSKSRQRAYSEYWTLIRGTNRKGAPRSDLQCPNCGAPLDVNMAGDCKYCKVKVTTGEFDWVLSRIEQDESYAG